MALPLGSLVSALALDPIEKKPLFHFFPGSKVFSVGFFGCNLACPFCQNWRISQDFYAQLEGQTLAPADLVRLARESGAPSLAFTYSEPSIHIEYLLEAAALARKAGLATVLVTNGSILGGPAGDLLPLMDAVNVDLKTWSRDSYRGVLRGDRDCVLNFISRASSLCHLEVTTLVVPGLSDSREGIEGIAAFLAGLDRAIPVHLSAYHPDWRYDRPPLEARALEALADLARTRLDFVYCGNLGGREEPSFCPGCGALLATRRGYRTTIGSLRPGPSLGGGYPRGRCATCGRDLAFVLQTP